MTRIPGFSSHGASDEPFNLSNKISRPSHFRRHFSRAIRETAYCAAGGGANGGGTSTSVGIVSVGEGCDSSCGSNEKSRCN